MKFLVVIFFSGRYYIRLGGSIIIIVFYIKIKMFEI